MAVHNVTEDAATFTCNAYLLTGDRPTLVDAGAMPDVVDVIDRYVDTVDAVLITHQHPDHVAELDAIIDAYDPAVYAAADHPARTDALADGDTVDAGDDRFEVVATPGHADDHVAFVSETTLFSGDVVVHDDAAFEDGSFGRTDGPDQSRATLVDSIRRLLDRLPSTVEDMYSGHGGEFHGDVHAVVERALERADRREPKYPE